MNNSIFLGRTDQDRRKIFIEERDLGSLVFICEETPFGYYKFDFPDENLVGLIEFLANYLKRKQSNFGKLVDEREKK